MGESIWQGVGQLPALQIVTLIQNNVQNIGVILKEGRKEDINKQKKGSGRKKKCLKQYGGVALDLEGQIQN